MMAAATTGTAAAAAATATTCIITATSTTTSSTFVFVLTEELTMTVAAPLSAHSSVLESVHSFNTAHILSLPVYKYLHHA